MKKLLAFLFCVPFWINAQSINITFRYVLEPNITPPARVFVPGQFNNWGPNTNGNIAAGAVSQMDLDASGAFYKKTISLVVGQSYMYKLHYHPTSAGTNGVWFSDPLNPKTNPNDNNNSVLDVVSPMAFAPARETNLAGQVKAFSVGLFSAKSITKIDFEVNGQVQANAINHFNTTNGIFRYVPSTPLPAGSGFKITATDADGKTATAEIKADIKPAITRAPRPSGAIEGINVNPNDPTEATFVLYAPKKDYVYLIGDFNNWETKPEFLMKKDSTAVDRVYWWATVKGLTPTVEYAYQYFVDGKIRVADPYATKILDPSADPFIPSTTYPNLKAYPSGKTEYDVSVFQTTKTAFNWTATNYQRPKASNLVIYELLIRDFSSARTYKAVQDSLGYLQKLGVNAIQLMPVQEFDGNDSWGYNPKFYFAPDKYYGTETALKQLIDECHKRGMAIILDVVYNHQTGASPFARLYNASTKGDPSAAITTDNYWLNTVAKHPFNVFNDANHEAWQLQSLMDRANKFWLTEYKFDGFRFDLSKGFTQKDTGNDVAAWGNYDASRVALLKRMAAEIRKVDPSAYIILEHFGGNTEELELAANGMLLWNNANSPFSEASMGYHDSSGKSNFANAYYKSRGFDIPNLISYMESHDEERMMFRNLTYGNTNAAGNYKVKDLWIALERQKAAGAMFFLTPGPKMIWQFGELGYDVSIDQNGRIGIKPVRWQYYNDPVRNRLYKTWSALLNLRHSNAVFTDPATTVSQDVSQSIKRINLTHPSMNVMIMANFNVNTVSYPANFQATGTWYDYFSGNALTVSNPQVELTLAAGEFRIYTNKPLPKPESGLIRVANEKENVMPSSFALLPNYPNPFNPSTTLRFALPQAASVSLEVFDLTGRKVATLANGHFAAGLHDAAFDAANLPSGLYLARLQTPNGTFTQKLNLVK